jgi:hypothetical protein
MKSLNQLVAENPTSAFLLERLAVQNSSLEKLSYPSGVSSNPWITTIFETSGAVVSAETRSSR